MTPDENRNMRVSVHLNAEKVTVHKAGDVQVIVKSINGPWAVDDCHDLPFKRKKLPRYNAHRGPKTPNP